MKRKPKRDPNMHYHKFVLDRNNRADDPFIHWACMTSEGNACTEVRWPRDNYNYNTLKNRKQRRGYYNYIRGRYREWYA